MHVRCGIDALYAFGSRATEALACVEGGRAFDAGGPSDLDLAVLPLPGRALSTDQRVALAAALWLKMAGYRNRMVHFYAESSRAGLYEICATRLFDVESARDALRLWLVAHPERIDTSL